MALYACETKTDEQGQELTQHGTAWFPIACYHDDLAKEPVPWHWHTELEAFVVAQGSAVAAAGAKRFLVRQGEGFFVNSGVLHAVWDHEESGCRLCSAVFHPRLVGGGAGSVFWQNYIDPLLGNPARKSLHLKGETDWHGAAIQAIQSAWTACVDEPPGYEFQVRDALSRLVFLLTQHGPAASRPPTKKTLRDEARVKTMMGYIQEHYGAELDTAAIAGSASISESECLRCFRSTIDTPPMRYVKEVRLRKAAELLLATERGIAEIGAQCGFLDASYFTKTFREWAGCAPSEYRKQVQG